MALERVQELAVRRVVHQHTAAHRGHKLAAIWLHVSAHAVLNSYMGCMAGESTPCGAALLLGRRGNKGGSPPPQARLYAGLRTWLETQVVANTLDPVFLGLWASEYGSVSALWRCTAAHIAAAAVHSSSLYTTHRGLRPRHHGTHGFLCWKFFLSCHLSQL